MEAPFDVLIVGSGPAGVSAAFPLLDAGWRVAMADGGQLPRVAPPEEDFLSARQRDPEQWRWMLGSDFHALRVREAVSPKLRVPPLAYVFDGFAAGNRVLTLASNMVTGYRIADMECCYKLVPVAMLRRLRPRLDEPRYGIEPQLVAALSALRARVEEVPVSYEPRGYAEGKKIRWTDGLAALWVIARERWRRD